MRARSLLKTYHDPPYKSITDEWSAVAKELLGEPDLNKPDGFMDDDPRLVRTMRPPLGRRATHDTEWQVIALESVGREFESCPY
jgi:hypothetical protein